MVDIRGLMGVQRERWVRRGKEGFRGVGGVRWSTREESKSKQREVKERRRGKGEESRGSLPIPEQVEESPGKPGIARVAAAVEQTVNFLLFLPNDVEMGGEVIRLFDLHIHQVAELQAEGLQYTQRAEHRRRCPSCLDSMTWSGSDFAVRQRALRRTGENRGSQLRAFELGRVEREDQSRY